ncbi:MAG: methyltransferase [Bdellovibrio sp. CG10_big_fil_rev_8_21_14_0_10_47_8]|nr:MAG: methyltransferase [Bdellovibrio sp. CG10_big_fil_rev_8_21_14_0_10_47_8]
MINTGPFPIRFPGAENLNQDKEWCEVQMDGEWKKIRFHDYASVFKIPGLYETIFYRTLRCNSPARIAGVLNDVLKEHNFPAQKLRVLDFGAGNGMAGEALQNLGTRNIVGVDILPEAREATLRDRPWVYNDYLIRDFTQLSAEDTEKLQQLRLNALIIVAALGFGDIPPKAFYEAYNLIEDGGWIAFNIKEDFLKASGRSGFSGLVNNMIRGELMRVELYRRYQHRLNVMGHPLYYITVVAQKQKSLSLADLKQAEL